MYRLHARVDGWRGNADRRRRSNRLWLHREFTPIHDHRVAARVPGAHQDADGLVCRLAVVDRAQQVAHVPQPVRAGRQARRPGLERAEDQRRFLWLQSVFARLWWSPVRVDGEQRGGLWLSGRGVVHTSFYELAHPAPTGNSPQPGPCSFAMGQQDGKETTMPRTLLPLPTGRSPNCPAVSANRYNSRTSRSNSATLNVSARRSAAISALPSSASPPSSFKDPRNILRR